MMRLSELRSYLCIVPSLGNWLRMPRVPDNLTWHWETSHVETKPVNTAADVNLVTTWWFYKSRGPTYVHCKAYWNSWIAFCFAGVNSLIVFPIFLRYSSTECVCHMNYVLMKYQYFNQLSLSHILLLAQSRFNHNWLLRVDPSFGTLIVFLSEVVGLQCTASLFYEQDRLWLCLHFFRQVIFTFSFSFSLMFVLFAENCIFWCWS